LWRSVTAFQKGFEFDFMAQRPIYEACPRWLIDRCQIGERSRVVDLGCGSGIVTQLLLDRFKESPDFRVIAIDPSPWELDIARSRISDERVTFVLGRAQEALSIVTDPVDAVFLCSVLHQVPLIERRSVIEGGLALVRPGGFLGANTFFYEGGIDAPTRLFQLRWMVEARKYLSRAGVSWTVPDKPPIALERLSPQQHYDLLRAAGCEEIHIEEVQLEWCVEDWEALSKYSVFIQGALSPDIDLEIGSRALIEGVRATYAGLGIDSVRRPCLHCVGRRPQ
jgi:trans-aconitate methyltransferase